MLAYNFGGSGSSLTKLRDVTRDVPLGGDDEAVTTFRGHFPLKI